MANIEDCDDKRSAALEVDTMLETHIPESLTPRSPSMAVPAIIPLRKACPKRFEGILSVAALVVRVTH